MEPFPQFRKGSKFLETKIVPLQEKGQNSSTKNVNKKVPFQKRSKIVKKMVQFWKRVKIPQQKWCYFKKGSKFLNKNSTITENCQNC